MRILVSNDDGVFSRGIQVLAEACQGIGEVTVVAPDREQSAQSHALTLGRPLRPVRRPDGSWQVDGTPTDCVMLAVDALMPERPDFVCSGINHGPNMGEDILYSGTVSAAMEGVVLGVPAIAFSLAGYQEELIPGYQPAVAALIRRVIALNAIPPNSLLNINLPPIPAREVRGVKITRLGSRAFSNSVTTQTDPWGREVYWIGGGTITWDNAEGTDHSAIAAGFISVTPLQIDLTSHRLIEVVQQWDLGGLL